MVIQAGFAHISRLWNGTKIELQGQYSIDRLYRVNAQCDSASMTRCVLVLLATPLPSLLITLAIECIPLADPRLGVDHAFLVYVRAFLVSAVVHCLLLHQCRLLIPVLPLSTALLLASSCVVAIGGAAVAYGSAQSIGFPLPFTLLLAMPVSSFLLGLPALAAWSSVLRHHPTARRDLANYIIAVVTKVVMTVAYSAFAFVFTNLPGKWHVPLVLVLTIFKRLAKTFIGHLFRDKHDIKANMVVLNANIYHTLFISWCMNGSRSVYSTLFFVLLDLGETLLAYRDVSNVHAELMSTLRLNALDSSCSNAIAPEEARIYGCSSLLDLVIAIWEHDRNKRGAHPNVQQLSDARPSMAWQWKPTTALIHPDGPSRSLVCLEHAESRPMGGTATHSSTSEDTGCLVIPCVRKEAGLNAMRFVVTLSSKERERCMRLVLQLHHTSEFLLLIEFVEAIVPAIYLVYTAGIYYLPNRNYFNTVRDLDDTKLKSQLANLALYWVIEVGSLALLCWLLQRKLGFSAIKQLAFVLESQWHLVQSKLVLWVVFAVQSRLEHFGTDFSFQFAWLSEKH